MPGVRLMPFKLHADPRGVLGAFESGADVDFQIKRVFYIKPAEGDVARAEHAFSATEAIVVLNGKAVADVDNGKERKNVTLRAGEGMLTIMPGIWLRLRDFDPCTIILVLASTTYAETTYSDSPFFKGS
ncbi:FdtA/QdtA family cupin domain-containing protein [Desulfovibrio sp. OttesenSCG-928-C14]|nr:FdtA/QdtA family cupin domain-containing protein [Desulfovibrio sp. OttesenSCG-928-C14]